MSNSLDLSQLSMLNLFQMEVESQIETLNHHLLTLETTPHHPAALQALMRSAHSIKGAARIVDLEAIVSLAHVMEDCFVAAQAGELTLQSDHIDTLLQSVDWFSQLIKIPEAKAEIWLSEQTVTIEQLISKISMLPFAEEKADFIPENDAPEILSEPSVALPQEPDPAVNRTLDRTLDRTRAVRLSQDNLNRLMGLAGESLIEANWLQPFADSLLLLKRQQSQLSQILEQLQTSAPAKYRLFRSCPQICPAMSANFRRSFK
jgi:two-component system, chemotaxis family, sensor histidine kinase and response regulator WspE